MNWLLWPYLRGQVCDNDVTFALIQLHKIAMIICSSQDLPGAVSAEEMARYLDLKELNERPYMFQEISTYDG